MKTPPQPCPIPRCALEWFLATFAAVIGTSIWWSGDPRFGHYDICLAVLRVPMDSMRWGITLWLIATIQAVALSLAPTGPQRLAGGVAAFTWAAFAMSAYHGGMLAFAAPASCLLALGQLYVCAMLRGARWTG